MTSRAWPGGAHGVHRVAADRPGTVRRCHRACPVPLPPDAAVLRLVCDTLEGVDALALRDRLLELPGVDSVALDLYARTADLYLDRRRATPSHLVAMARERVRLPGARPSFTGRPSRARRSARRRCCSSSSDDSASEVAPPSPASRSPRHTPRSPGPKHRATPGLNHCRRHHRTATAPSRRTPRTHGHRVRESTRMVFPSLRSLADVVIRAGAITRPERCRCS